MVVEEAFEFSTAAQLVEVGEIGPVLLKEGWIHPVDAQDASPAEEYSQVSGTADAESKAG